MTTTMKTIREWFRTTLPSKHGMVELIGSSFYADEPTIFGEPNEDYIMREIDWYLGQSLNVKDIPGTVPQIWLDVSGDHGEINSNYGYLLFNEGNGEQYTNVLEELKKPGSRRAVAIYTRPHIHDEFSSFGMNDFICTNAVNYYSRNGYLHSVVQMRSNDVVYGYRNDWAWQQFVVQKLCDELDLKQGSMIWQAGSLHVYPRHFHLLA